MIIQKYQTYFIINCVASALPTCLSKPWVVVEIKESQSHGLTGIGSFAYFIDLSTVQKLNIFILPVRANELSMESTNLRWSKLIRLI